MTPRLLSQRRKALRARFVVALALRRGAVTLPAQQVAVYVLARAAQERRTEQGESAQADVEVWGAPDLDVRRGDRFTWDGSLCEVILVRPGRTTATVAEAVLVA